MPLLAIRRGARRAQISTTCPSRILIGTLGVRISTPALNGVFDGIGPGDWTTIGRYGTVSFGTSIVTTSTALEIVWNLNLIFQVITMPLRKRKQVVQPRTFSPDQA